MATGGLPLVDPIERALYLRMLPMFADLDSAHIAALARVLEEGTVASGTVLREEGAIASEAYIVVAGRVRESRGGTGAIREAPAALGGYDLLAGEGHSPRVEAVSDLRVLSLLRTTLVDFLNEDVDLRSRIRSQATNRLCALRVETGTTRPWWIESRANTDPEAAGRSVPGFVERVRLLAQAPIWQHAYLDDIAEMAANSVFIPMNAGDTLWSAADAAIRFAVVASGSVRCEGGQSVPAFTAARADAIGVEACLDERPHFETVTAQTQSAVLAFAADDVRKVVETHTSLGMSLLAGLAREVLRLEAIRGNDAGQGGEHRSSAVGRR